jgi:hypothetical protein
VDSTGGFLLPGSGWFPQLAPESDERVVHSTSFALPAGWTGIAAGSSGAPGAWTTGAAGRPFAVWGEYERSDAGAAATGGESVACAVYRRSGASGEVPRLSLLADVVQNLETGLGPAAGEGPFKLIDVGKGVMWGGLRAVFWDEEASRRVSTGKAARLLERDLSGALASSFWTESVTCRGELGAWISRAFARYLGDVAYVALDASDRRNELEAVVIGARRAAFLEALEGDRPLQGLVPLSPNGSLVLEGRGALVAHLAAEAARTRSDWIAELRRLRGALGDATLDWSGFRELIKERFPVHHQDLRPFLETTDLPDFRIASHGPSEKHKGRYRVEVVNKGIIEAPAEVVTYTRDGHELHTFRLPIGPGDSRAIQFQDAERIGRVAVDPRGVTPQKALDQETVVLVASSAKPEEPYVPSFPFETDMGSMRSVQGFALELDGVSIVDFNGDLQWYWTHHGPSGACLLGTGTVVVAPSGPFAPGFRQAMGRDSLSFRECGQIWVRFPPASWKRIEAQLGAASPLENRERIHGVRIVYEHSFPTFFFEASRAQVPPPGSSLVIFTASGGERRGFVRRPLPDGRVFARFWDHLKGETIWEETR